MKYINDKSYNMCFQRTVQNIVGTFLLTTHFYLLRGSLIHSKVSSVKTNIALQQRSDLEVKVLKNKNCHGLSDIREKITFFSCLDDTKTEQVIDVAILPRQD